MTSNDIHNVQIIATSKDGQHIMAVSDDRKLIRFIAEYCQFMRMKEELFEQCSLKELIADDNIEEQDPKADIKAKRIEDCNLSVRTTNICKAVGIDTLGDLCKLHKTDWMSFRNGGKKSFSELDDLLHDNGLDWAEWRQ